MKGEHLKGKFGKLHPTWKSKVTYSAIHKWVVVRLGKPHCCDNCLRIDLRHRQYHWANISGNYKRIITDWQRLCIKCHKKFDKARGRWANSTGRPKKS